ncbi:DUF4145 domain-containing protein [Fructilactobacillus fructivorans]|uniref:DUF4145 domain-containing protein n=1 Tax=Fructilactobacillus fructivorans TaxID=1614 RepID=UPI0002196CAF|nr:DUF4145 domain-containing protein [Fructilactobacillus fructivorans]
MHLWVYRKALEFLVKDFLSYLYPKEAGTIKNEWLGTCIKRLSTLNPILNANATMVTWIGNNSTHYNKLHPELNIDDLKKYLDVLTAYIAFYVQGKEGEKYIDEHSSKKK